MAIVLASSFSQFMDEHIRVGLTSGFMEKAPDSGIFTFGNGASVNVQTMTTSGYLNFSRTSATQVAGNISTTSKSYTLQYQRQVSLPFNILDGEESGGVLTIENVVKTFMDQKAIPEIDAIRYSIIAGQATTDGHSTEEDLTVANVMERINADFNAVLNREGAMSNEQLVLYASYEVKGLMESAMLDKSLIVTTSYDSILKTTVFLYNGVRIIFVPQSRFYTSVTLSNTGNGGYAKTAVIGRDLNYIVANVVNSTYGIIRNNDSKVVSPDTQAGSWNYTFDNVLYHDLFIPDEQVDGIQTSYKTI